VSDEKRSGEDEPGRLLMHVPLRVSIELGSCTMLISEILKLGTGSIVEVSRNANQPVDLLVNDRPIARGEIVAVEDNFGLRITELLAL
jgi:flagellar motor switch protein FliN/FliY